MCVEKEILLGLERYVGLNTIISNTNQMKIEWKRTEQPIFAVAVERNDKLWRVGSEMDVNQFLIC
jgi:hypothetical protein